MAARADDPADAFLNLYRKFGVAETAEAKGQTGLALKAYREVDEGLQRLAADFPEWSPQIIKFRRQKAVEGMKRVLDRMEQGNARPDGDRKATPPEAPRSPSPAPDDEPRSYKPVPPNILTIPAPAEREKRSQWEEMRLHRGWLLGPPR
jgi:hypothetical protein